jgi:N-acetylmuramoyl-L-alanine amidase
VNAVNPITKFVVHHSASDPERTSVQDIRDWHRARGFDDVGYHRIITSLAMLEPGRDLTYVPAAQKGENTGTFTVCVVGDNTKEVHRWRREQVLTLMKLWVAVKTIWPRCEPFGHRDLATGTECPGVDIRRMLLGPRGE